MVRGGQGDIVVDLEGEGWVPAGSLAVDLEVERADRGSSCVCGSYGADRETYFWTWRVRGGECGLFVYVGSEGVGRKRGRAGELAVVMEGEGWAMA